MITELLLVFGGWLVLLYLSVVLIGVFVQGLVNAVYIKREFSKKDKDFKEKAGRLFNSKQEKRSSAIAGVIIVGYLAALLYFWNIGVVIVAIMIMLARIPDLFWEINYGPDKFNKMPAIYLLTILLALASLPVLWYSIHGL